MNNKKETLHMLESTKIASDMKLWRLLSSPKGGEEGAAPSIFVSSI